MTNEEQQRLADLEQQVAGLRRNFIRMLRIVDHVAKPRALDRSMIEVCATKRQEKAFYDLMDHLSQQITVGQPVMAREIFERRVSEIFPAREDDTHSVEGFLIAAARDGRWRTVYEHMERNGVNLPASFDDLETTR